MNDTQTKLGKLIDVTAVRDAVHVAVAPVFTDERLRPGQHVGFAEEGNSIKISGKDGVKKIGIVDPFLPKEVYPGDGFYLFLYPNTVTGMTHHWQHPAFEDQEAAANLRKVESSGSRKVIQEYADRMGRSYDEMMRIADRYNEDGENTHNGDDESYGDFEWRDFWVAYERITGKTVEYQNHAPFSCAC